MEQQASIWFAWDRDGDPAIWVGTQPPVAVDGNFREAHHRQTARVASGAMVTECARRLELQPGQIVALAPVADAGG